MRRRSSRLGPLRESRRLPGRRLDAGRPGAGPAFGRCRRGCVEFATIDRRAAPTSRMRSRDLERWPPTRPVLLRLHRHRPPGHRSHPDRLADRRPRRRLTVRRPSGSAARLPGLHRHRRLTPTRRNHGRRRNGTGSRARLHRHRSRHQHRCDQRTDRHRPRPHRHNGRRDVLRPSTPPRLDRPSSPLSAGVAHASRRPEQVGRSLIGQLAAGARPAA